MFNKNKTVFALDIAIIIFLLMTACNLGSATQAWATATSTRTFPNTSTSTATTTFTPPADLTQAAQDTVATAAVVVASPTSTKPAVPTATDTATDTATYTATDTTINLGVTPLMPISTWTKVPTATNTPLGIVVGLSNQTPTKKPLVLLPTNTQVTISGKVTKITASVDPATAHVSSCSASPAEKITISVTASAAMSATLGFDVSLNGNNVFHWGPIEDFFFNGPATETIDITYYPDKGCGTYKVVLYTGPNKLTTSTSFKLVSP